MTGLRLLTLLSAFVLIAVLGGSVARAHQTLPLELAEILPMSADELVEMADQSADFITTSPALVEKEQETHEQIESSEPASLAEVNQEMQSEAQVEQQVEQEAASQEGNVPLPALPEPTPAPAPAAGEPAPAAAPAAGEDEKPVLPMESATRRLKRHRDEIRDLEKKMQEQTALFKQHTADPVPTLRGKPISSGANYWEGKIDELKSSSVKVVTDSASDLTQTDARCVICQFLVQQAMGVLSGKPLTTGGATSGGKRAAAAADAAAAAAPAEEAQAFLEFESQMDEMEEEMEDSEDPFEFLELDASLGVFAESGLEAVLAAEMESTVALNAAMENFLSASDSAMEHSATEAVLSHYRLHRRPYMGPNLRNVNPVSYPSQLNDFGFEENSRNRAADVLAYRPRQARFARGDAAVVQAKWDETHATYQKLYTGVYHAFESLCTKRMPLAYVGYCQEMMRDYRYIAQGIQYGDRAQSICMNGNWCDKKAYIRHAVHAYFVRAPGDN